MHFVKKATSLFLLIAIVSALGATAVAQPLHLQPGSVLVFPLYDSSPGAGTVICVTNLNDDNLFCPNSDFRQGDILVHYQYIDGATWQEFDRFEFLTPGDTLCVLADLHNPEQDQGFLVVSAVDPSNMDRRVDFDHLIGSSIVVQSGLNFLWSYTPYAFRALPSAGAPGDPCNLPSTDADADTAIDWDGTEYDVFPAQLFIDSFFEETGGFENQLTLLTTAGANYTAEVRFLFWNNIEMKFSRSFEFVCWHTCPLSEISNIVTNLGGDEEELGQGARETGWASIMGSRIIDGAGNPVQNDGGGNAVPPILGVFSQFITGSDFSAGHALHYRGSVDGLEMFGGNRDPQMAGAQ